MKYAFGLLLRTTVLLLIVFLNQAAAEPFAPLVPISDDMLQESHEAHFDALTAQNSKIPDRSEVGIPPYPNAKILFTQMNNQMHEGDKTIDLPKRIYMGTSDSTEAVVEFYKQNLEGWRYGKFYGTPTFYKKEGEFKPMEDMTTPRIVIAPEFRTRKLMPESKTTIDIYYERSN